ncbi:MAG TPA: hypothetical protein VGP93_07760 [Polyangiaceae bacterium]|nr:hypothetical protein [Polyangiaceae bacterium]
MQNSPETQVPVFAQPSPVPVPTPPPRDSEDVDYIRDLLKLLEADALAESASPESE